ncbi:MAG: DNA replication and repair protein RecF [Acholeplasmataceae bacterium]
MINYLSVRNFRNLSDFKINIENKMLVLEGENGTGKTSLLEAIYLTATTKSHRTNHDKDLIKKDSEFTKVNLKTSSDEYQVVITDNSKRVFINKEEIKTLSNFIGNISVVLFAPEDLFLIKGSPSIRRNFMDLELVQFSKEYLSNLNNYRNILKQRNILLKKIKINDDYTFLNILGEQLYNYGSKIYESRREFIQELNIILEKESKNYSNFNLKIQYNPNIKLDSWLKTLKTKQKQDIIFGQTLSGIHKDDLNILFNNQSLKDFGSQGMIRLAAILIKVSLLKWLISKNKKEIVLLLDDVFSELDQNIQNIFIKSLPNDIQTIITTAIPLENDKDFQKIILNKGAINGQS